MLYFIFQKWWYNCIEKTFGSKHGLIAKQCEEEMNIKHKKSNGNATYKKSLAISFILRLCLHVVVPSTKSVGKEVLPNLVEKKKQLYVLLVLTNCVDN